MYCLNTLMRDVLITPQEVMFHAPTKHEMDIRMLEQSIIIAEERYIRPELGTKLYDAIALAKNTTVTNLNKDALQALVGEEPTLKEDDVVNALEFLSTEYKTLWKKYLWKLTAECVIATAFAEGFIQFSSEGPFHSVPPAGLMVSSGLVTPLLSSMKWVLDKKSQDRIAPLAQAMHNFLCSNKSSYILYNGDCPEEDCDGNIEEKKDKWAGICVDMYTDIDTANNNL